VKSFDKQSIFSCTKDVKEELTHNFEKDDLHEASVLIVADWAMKFEHTRFRENQSDWYSKRRLSWHVSRVISKDSSTDTFTVTTYVHLCTQDWFAVASIVENLLSSW
jgi:hypothetical protein